MDLTAKPIYDRHRANTIIMMRKQLQHELELAKSKNLILGVAIKPWTQTCPHGQVWYIKLTSTTTDKQIQQLRKYIEQSPDVAMTDAPLLTTDVLRVYFK